MSTITRIPGLTARESERLHALARKAEAKVTIKAVQPKADEPAKVTKGAQSRQTLSRKDWNRTLTAKARLAGKRNGVSIYSLVIAQWADVQQARTDGYTPDEVLAQI